MSILNQVTKPQDEPVVCTILGEAGLGKTSLAATFPKPIFIRAENGLQAIPFEQRPDALPVVESVEQLWEQLSALITEEHEYKTVVIDSVTRLEQLFIQHIVDTDEKKPKSINQALGGYGAGLSAVAALHARVRKACAKLNEKRGMHVVFIAHADTETIDLPDADPYTRYTLRLGKKSMAPYVDDADLVGFIRLETFTKDKKATTDGTRVLNCAATASNVSKNRFGIKENVIIKQGQNPFIGLIPSLTQGN